MKKRLLQISFLSLLLLVICVVPMIPKKSADAAGLVYRWNISMRDPFIMRVGSTYYMYGTSGTGFTGYYSTDPNLENWYGPYTVFSGSGWGGTFWAPEVHQVGSYYYMFASMQPPGASYRGTYVLRSSSPLGTYASWSTGPVTDPTKNCIDGTLHFEGTTPWLVYVDEWTNYNPTVGKMRAVQLASDLKTRIVSTDRLLFHANAPTWSRGIVTDGPQMYKTANGTLLMLWSTYAWYNSPTHLHYTIALAKSSNGTITGTWSQVGSKPLYYGDGGHGMALTMANGSKKLVYHSYNSGSVRPVFIDLYESGSTLTLGNVPSYVQAYWRFEDAYLDGGYIQPITPVLDFSGKGNDLHTYSSGTAGQFSTAIPLSSVRETGARNRFSYNNNINPGTGCTTRDLYTPANMNPPLMEANYYNWTIEASIRISRTGLWQVFVGRDGNIVSYLPPLAFKVTNQNKVMIQYVQADGNVGICTNNTTLSANVWYDVVAVKSGSTLYVYVKTSSSSTFPSPATVSLSGNTYMYNNHAAWTVGRGMYNGVLTDQFFGCIDEVRISNTALSTSYFLQTP